MMDKRLDNKKYTERHLFSDEDRIINKCYGLSTRFVYQDLKEHSFWVSSHIVVLSLCALKPSQYHGIITLSHRNRLLYNEIFQYLQN